MLGDVSRQVLDDLRQIPGVPCRVRRLADLQSDVPRHQVANAINWLVRAGELTRPRRGWVVLSAASRIRSVTLAEIDATIAEGGGEAVLQLLRQREIFP